MNETPSRIIEDFRWAPAPAPPPPASSSWGWAALTCAMILLLAAAVFLLRRKKKQGSFFKPPEPHEVALAALQELAGLIRDDGGLEFVIAVSKVVRVYLQDRFGFRAPHRSTEEFLEEASRSDVLTQEHQLRLGDFLWRCDLVKFAKRNVAVAEMEKLLKSARGFVLATAPKQPEVADAK